MTNFERLCETHKDLIIQCIAERICVDKNSGSVALCGYNGLDCKDCAFANDEENCDVPFAKKWLEEEYNNPYKIGQLILVDDGICFYNGYYKGKHYVVDYITNVNKRYKTGEPYGSALLSTALIKEYNPNDRV